MKKLRKVYAQILSKIEQSGEKGIGFAELEDFATTEKISAKSNLRYILKNLRTKKR